MVMTTAHAELAPPEVTGLTVVKGTPDPEEVAALVASLTLLAGSYTHTPVPDAVPHAWADRAAALGAPVAPGPHAWRWSSHPRR